MEGTRTKGGNQSFRHNIHGGHLRIGEQSGALVENRAVIKSSVPGKDRNVIQMAVVVENQSVDLKKKGQLFWKLLQSSQLGSCLCQVCNSFFVTGQAFQEIF